MFSGLKKPFLHNVGYAAIGVVLFFILMALKPTTTHSICGIFLPTQHAIVKPGKVAKIVTELPINYVVLGHVSLMLYSDTQQPERKRELSLVKAALKMVALHGGNGLYLNQLGYASPGEVGNLLSGYVLSGEAIEVGAM